MKWLMDTTSITIDHNNHVESGMLVGGEEKPTAWMTKSAGGGDPIDKAQCVRFTVETPEFTRYFYVGNNVS